MNRRLLAALLCLAPTLAFVPHSRDVEAASTGQIVGIVKVAGPIPKLAPRSISKAFQAVCGRGSLPPQALICDRTGGVRDAVVSLRGIAPLSASGGAAPEVTVRQTGCDYQPHVQIAQVGTKAKIVNDDDTMHNIHAYHENGRQPFNIAQPLKGLVNIRTLTDPGVMQLACDSGHPWMRAFIIVVDHPFHALTTDDGSFTIENVPAGQYRLGMWHEYLGRAEESVTVTPGSVSRVTFKVPVPAKPFTS